MEPIKKSVCFQDETSQRILRKLIKTPGSDALNSFELQIIVNLAFFVSKKFQKKKHLFLNNLKKLLKKKCV